MKKILFIIVLLSANLGTSQTQKENPTQKHNKSNGFIKNKGQVIDQDGKQNNEVLYLLNTDGLSVQLRKSGFSYDVYEEENKKLNNNINKRQKISSNHQEMDSLSMLIHRIDFDFLDINKDLVLKEYEISKSHINYYNVAGNSDGVTKVHSYKRIVYKNLYQGIDLEFFVPLDRYKPVEYNFVIRPEGDISCIKMKISGADAGLTNNSLKMNLIHGTMSETIPKSWIRTNDCVNEVVVSYIEKGKNIFGFKVDDHNITKMSTLIIDPTPVREWGTYFGGSNSDGSDYGSMDYDSNGHTVYACQTTSDNIATSGSHQPYNFIFSTALRHNTGLLMKFDEKGELIWSTYYGGIGPTEFFDIKTDNENNIIAVGYTYANTNIATPNSHQEFKGGDENDGFIVKLNSNGERIWASYYGGIGQDVIKTVSTDNSNNIYIAGDTGSEENMISANAFDTDFTTNRGLYANEGFIAKFDKNGNRKWGTYYGGTGSDVINNLEIGNDSNIYIIGFTNSETDIATSGSYKQELSLNNGSSDRIDTFIAKFNSDGNRIWGTYFGGTGIDWGHDITTDSSNNIIISGATQSDSGIAFNNAHKSELGGDWDDFLAKFTENGELLWSSYYGGSQRENYVTCAVDTDINNNIYLTGGTSSNSNIATVGSYQENYVGYSNAYLVKFDEFGNRIWGTYYGEYQAVGTDVKVVDEAVYVFGVTSSNTGIASEGAYQSEVNGTDCFIVKFVECENLIEANVTEFLCSGETISFKSSGGITYSWSGPNGFLSTVQNPIIQNARVTDSGTYSVYIETSDGCSDTRTLEVVVSKKPTAYRVKNIEVCEDIFSTGISSSINTSNIESQVLGNQMGLVVKYFDNSGNPLPNPLPNPMTNSVANRETILVRVYNDNNLECYTETPFKIIVNALPKINELADIFSCDTNADGISIFDISNLEINLLGGQTGMKIDFYHENGQKFSFPIPNSISNKVPNQETITGRITNPNTNCFSETTFKFIVNPIPIANSMNTLTGCDDNNDGISEYFDTSEVESLVLGNQTGMVVTYFDSNRNQLSSPLPNPYTNTKANQETITLRVTNPQTGCYSETFLNLATSSKPQINQPASLYACDEANGISHFDTSVIENQLIGNQTGLVIFYADENGNQLPSPLPLSYQNTKPWKQTIQVKVENELNSLCYSITSFEIIVNELPQINLENEYFLCDLEPSLYIAEDSNFDSWKWTFEDGSVISNSFDVNLIDAGTYTLQVTRIKNGVSCENSFSFNLVRSMLPTITEVKIKDISDSNYIEIITSGDGDFEYSIDGSNFQDANVFQNLSGGVYNVQVRDKKGCGIDTTEVVLVDYPKFFTPNKDGYNDYWQIDGVNKFPYSKIFIYDRYGKLLKELTSSNLGWDGSFNGNKMPSNDYWFIVNLSDGRTFNGHFSLIR
jgi:gliding motility-associated-like protein